MKWPVIDSDLEHLVTGQLKKGISIYGNDGVFQTFETEFKAYHNMMDCFALLHNSGTNALHALHFAAQLRPDDEVIFPVYTFHATCSPAMHFGVKPVFCDVTQDGNISPTAIEKAITAKTKAVVVTHMWGISCDMQAILAILDSRKDILLFEDCSHAHGARINGRHVGSFGDGAVWSLQGQKIVTGGEGGIAVTKHADFHYRQLIWGHYNKRCKAEIPANHPLHAFILTGAGLKHKAHPLAVAVTLHQLRSLDEFHAQKTRYAYQMARELDYIPFLEMPSLNRVGAATCEPAWYAFVMRFKSSKAPNGLTREKFVEEINARGLKDVDTPRSTRLLHRELLFNTPAVLFPHLYSKESANLSRSQGDFENAQQFYDEAIKLPVYAVARDQETVNVYIRVITFVANKWTRGE